LFEEFDDKLLLVDNIQKPLSGIPGLPQAFSFKNITFEKLITIKHINRIFIVFLSI
jgi:hypothetical protein